MLQTTARCPPGAHRGQTRGGPPRSTCLSQGSSIPKSLTPRRRLQRPNPSKTKRCTPGVKIKPAKTQTNERTMHTARLLLPDMHHIYCCTLTYRMRDIAPACTPGCTSSCYPLRDTPQQKPFYYIVKLKPTHKPTRNPKPQNTKPPNPKPPKTQKPKKPKTQNPKTPKPQSLNPKTPNAKPQTLNPNKTPKP